MEVIVFFDVGVRNAVLNQHNNVFTKTQMGHLFEQWFFTQILAYSDYHRKNWKFFYYRDDLKQEVDLVIDTGVKLIGIEIKFSTTFKAGFVSGLKTGTSW